MSKRITTVLGDIAPEQLGFTSMHEHVLMNGSVFRREMVEGNPDLKEPIPGDAKVTIENSAYCRRNFFVTWDAQDLDDEEVMAGEVQDFKDAGGAGLLELSAPGIRGDVEGIRRIAKKTGMHIVVPTGFYTQNSWSPELFELDRKGFYKAMLHETEHGVAGTDIKPGHLKIGMCQFSSHEEAALRAAAQVSRETGLSLTVHPTFGSGHGPRKIVQVCKEEGMDLGRLVLAHMTGFITEGNLRTLVMHPETRAVNLDTLLAVVDQGANVSLEFANPSEFEMGGSVNPEGYQRLHAVVQMISRGYVSQVVLATDTCAKPMARRYGGEGYCRLTNYAIPSLRKFCGVSDVMIDQMMVRNPARILAY